MTVVGTGRSGSSELRGQQSVATDDRREPQGQWLGRSGEIRRRALIGRSEGKSKVITASTMKKPPSNQAGVAVSGFPGQLARRAVPGQALVSLVQRSLGVVKRSCTRSAVA